MAGSGMDFMRMLAGPDGEAEEARPKLAADIERIRLVDCLSAFNERHEFRPGMIVRQKPQALNYKGFGDNDQAIVVELLAEPIIAGLEAHGTSHYRERQDMIVGSLEDGKLFCLFHVDSRRFEPVPADEAAAE